MCAQFTSLQPSDAQIDGLPCCPGYHILYIRVFTIFVDNHIVFVENPTNRINEVFIKRGIRQTWLAF